MQAWDENGKPLDAFLLSKAEFESIMKKKQKKGGYRPGITAQDLVDEIAPEVIRILMSI